MKKSFEESTRVILIRSDDTIKLMESALKTNIRTLRTNLVVAQEVIVVDERKTERQYKRVEGIYEALIYLFVNSVLVTNKHPSPKEICEKKLPKTLWKIKL